MRSEIPQLEVITAIADADFEDFVAQLLFSQGWSIIYRAFDAAAMRTFLSERSGLRTVIIYKADLPGFTSELIMDYEDDPYTFISLDGSEPAAHAVMQKIRTQLRLPMVHVGQAPAATSMATHTSPTSSRSRVVLAPKVVTITGSAGAPGRTTLALALGEEFAALRGKGIGMIDADFRSRTLSRRLSGTYAAPKVLSKTLNKSPARERLSLLPLEAAEKPTKLPELTPDETAIVDLGTLPSLGEAVHDRRWHGSLVTSILEATTNLLYVVRSTQESLDELAVFLKEFPILLRKIPITYICVLVGNSRELREAEARFLTLTAAENRFLIRGSKLQACGGVLGALGTSSAKPGKGEIGKIAQSLL
jgi:hypothetical protein